MSGIKISDLPRISEVTGREVFVSARDRGNWAVLLEQIRGRIVLPEDFGARGDGQSDDTQAMAAAVNAAASMGRPLLLAGAKYRIASDLLIDVPVHFLGAVLIVDRSATVSITGRLCANPERIFQGNIEGPLNAEEIHPEWFGAVGGDYEAADAVDDTKAIQAAINAAGGGVLRLNALYRVRPNRLTLYTRNSGLCLVGRSGAAMRGPGGSRGEYRLGKPTGFILLEDGDWMFRLGATGQGERGCNQLVIRDVIFDGDHRKCHLGLVWAQLVSQSKMERVVVRNVRGPGLFVNKLEDVNISDSQFGKLGDVDNVWGYRGGIIFGAPPKFAGIGTNVLFFIACRFEWMDGGYFRIVREPGESSSYYFNNNTIPYVHHLIMVQCKLEVGMIDEDGQTYGSTRNQWAVFEFGEAAHGESEVDTKGRDRPRFANNFRITSCHFNGLHHARTFVRAGNLANFSVCLNNMTFSSYVQNPQSLFELMNDAGEEVDCENFIMKDNVAWVKGGAENFAFTYLDRSRYELHYEPPITARLKKQASRAGPE